MTDVLLFLILVCQILFLFRTRKKDLSEEDALVQGATSELGEAQKRIPPQH